MRGESASTHMGELERLDVDAVLLGAFDEVASGVLERQADVVCDGQVHGSTAND